ncbi:MAG: hypothetical protein DPW09_35070 [Anaerolineae bacterium]|nr:hypothetical protein [Anaerolineales bacterium]MCQ3978673.1 hypothetical protein [Anaerolineae bacterium]
MLIHPDDRVLVAVMNKRADWQRVQAEGWYRLPVKHAPEGTPHFDWLAFYFTSAFGADKWAVHYYARIEGHELLTRRDLLPAEPGHKRAGDWYYKLTIGALQYKLPPIVSHNWRRITFIVTSGDRFEAAEEINDLFEHKSPAGRLYVTLREAGFHPERDWPLRERGVTYRVDLALPLDNKQGWLPIVLAAPDLPAPPQALRFAPDSDPTDCARIIRQRLAESGG